MLLCLDSKRTLLKQQQHSRKLLYLSRENVFQQTHYFTTYFTGAKAVLHDLIFTNTAYAIPIPFRQ